MEKMGVLRTICRAACFRSSRFSAIVHDQLHHHMASRSLFTVSPPSVSTTQKGIPCDFMSPFAMSVGSARSFGLDDYELDELPSVVVSDAKKALSKNTDNKAGQEILKNVFRAAEAVEEFDRKIMTLKMDLDDSIGISGEDVKPLPEEHVNVIRTFYQR